MKLEHAYSLLHRLIDDSIGYTELTLLYERSHKKEQLETFLKKHNLLTSTLSLDQKNEDLGILFQDFMQMYAVAADKSWRKSAKSSHYHAFLVCATFSALLGKLSSQELINVKNSITQTQNLSISIQLNDLINKTLKTLRLDHLEATATASTPLITAEEEKRQDFEEKAQRLISHLNPLCTDRFTTEKLSALLEINKQIKDLREAYPEYEDEYQERWAVILEKTSMLTQLRFLKDQLNWTETELVRVRSKIGDPRSIKVNLQIANEIQPGYTSLTLQFDYLLAFAEFQTTRKIYFKRLKKYTQKCQDAPDELRALISPPHALGEPELAKEIFTEAQASAQLITQQLSEWDAWLRGIYPDIQKRLSSLADPTEAQVTAKKSALQNLYSALSSARIFLRTLQNAWKDYSLYENDINVIDIPALRETLETNLVFFIHTLKWIEKFLLNKATKQLFEEKSLFSFFRSDTLNFAEDILKKIIRIDIKTLPRDRLHPSTAPILMLANQGDEPSAPPSSPS